MNYNKVKYTLSMFVIISLFLLCTSIIDAKPQTPLPYHFQNANIFFERGKTHFEWYNNEVGRYGIYEYKWITYANGKRNLIPYTVWSKFLRIGNVRVTIPRQAFRWKVIYISPR